jgi:signal transduction histidine kinase
VGTALIRSFSLKALAKAVVEHLPPLGIDFCVIGLFQGTGRPAPRSQLVLAFDGEHLEVKSEIPTLCLFPSELAHPIERYSRVVEPLFFEREAMGFGALSLVPGRSLIYGSIDQQLSVALRGALLVEEVVRSNELRQALLEDLAERNNELEQAYSTWKFTQKQLLAVEKMASLGRLTANIAHEMNTPLAAVRTAMSDLGDLVREYEESIGDPEVTAKDHQDISAEMTKAVNIAQSAAAKAASFVRGVKTQTRDLGPAERVPFDPVAVIDEVLMLLGRSMKEARVTVEFKRPEEPIELIGTPGRLAQVITNLVTNAADASQGCPDPVDASRPRASSSDRCSPAWSRRWRARSASWA